MQANLQELKETYSRQTYSVFSINRQQKIADSQVTFSLAHSVFIIPVTIGGKEFICEGTTVVHAPAGQTVTYRTLYGRSFDHINIYYDGVQGDTSSPIFNAYAFDPQGFDRILDKTLDLEKLNTTPSLDNRVAQIVNGTDQINVPAHQQPKGPGKHGRGSHVH